MGSWKRDAIETSETFSSWSVAFGCERTVFVTSGMCAKSKKIASKRPSKRPLRGSCRSSSSDISTPIFATKTSVVLWSCACVGHLFRNFFTISATFYRHWECINYQRDRHEDERMRISSFGRSDASEKSEERKTNEIQKVENTRLRKLQNVLDSDDSKAEITVLQRTLM